MTTARRPLGAVTVREALDSARIPLAAAGCDTPELDAEVLLADVLGLDRTALYADPARALEPGQVRRYQQHVLRRRHREPVAYVVGRRGFRGIELAVDPRVLIPRPETELLVEVALGLAPGARVVDVGTGSGAVALGLKAERPDLRVVATDASDDALAVAAANVAALGLEVELVAGDLLEGVAGPVDAVLSNPPYVADGDWAALAPEIAAHEPAEALLAGPDGLDVIRRLVPAAEAAGAGLLAVEVGAGQAPAVAELAARAGFAHVEAIEDLAGIERVVVARR